MFALSPYARTFTPAARAKTGEMYRPQTTGIPLPTMGPQMMGPPRMGPSMMGPLMGPLRMGPQTTGILMMGPPWMGPQTVVPSTRGPSKRNRRNRGKRQNRRKKPYQISEDLPSDEVELSSEAERRKELIKSLNVFLYRRKTLSIYP